MKNKIIYAIGWVLLLIVSGCSDWLSVSPRTEKPTEQLFETQNGFRDALTGAYIEMMSDKSYGEYLTMSKIEYLVDFWDPEKGSGEEALTLHRYSDAQAVTMIDALYEQQYKVILAVNAILEYVDLRQAIFDPGAYEAVKGECLALRAMCHLDILRLFGPVPAEATSVPILPYVETVTKELHRHVNFDGYKARLIADLENAEGLLKQHLEKQSEIEEDYFKYRTIRMNYYAVKALQARAYLWFGDTQKAYEAAQAVITAKDEDGNPRFRLGTAGDFSEGRFTLPCEQVFSLYRVDLPDKYTELFSGDGLYKGTKETTVKKELYGNTGSDIREMNLWNLLVMANKASYYVCNKYQVTEATSEKEEDKVIPLLRLSEMYLIAIEAGPETEAQRLWKEFLSARNLVTADLPSDAALRKAAIIAEYRKEFYGEGVTFFLHKRLNLPKNQWLWAPSDLEVNYVLPLPETELSEK